ncbi:Os04g0254100 [Oryza sativa Japonica Group]|uniref:Os04g0254100 protein n=1 Tax=Oryza sativa subsp. japonica TaxID=39947 RepID=A0A0P0W7P8_ORYSJ|nr:Os04g0254100 [Oryza sativa Japonica Group]
MAREGGCHLQDSLVAPSVAPTSTAIVPPPPRRASVPLPWLRSLLLPPLADADPPPPSRESTAITTSVVVAAIFLSSCHQPLPSAIHPSYRMPPLPTSPLLVTVVATGGRRIEDQR